MHADPSAAARAQAPRLAPHSTGFEPAAAHGIAPAGPQHHPPSGGQALRTAPGTHYQPAAPGRCHGPVTGAYMPSGDPAIDRMVALERALKLYGSPL